MTGVSGHGKELKKFLRALLAASPHLTSEPRQVSSNWQQFVGYDTSTADSPTTNTVITKLTLLTKTLVKMIDMNKFIFATLEFFIRNS